MSDPAAMLAARAQRDDARAVFDARLAIVKSDLEARGVGGRIADRIGADAAIAIEEGLEIADQHRGVIAGTIAALAIWFLRHPIIAWIDSMLGEDDHDEED